jgi:Fic family protein
MPLSLTEDRKFKDTHPWIRFALDMNRAPAALWILLGECRSKCEHIAGVPLKPSVAENLHRLYLAKGVLATTAIEGNTLSEEEVLQHLDGKLKLPPSREYLAQEIDNILAECNRVLRSISEGEAPPLTLDRVRELNRTVLDGLSLESGVVPGEIRHHSVGVARYRGAPHEDCEFLLNRMCEWLESSDFEPPTKEDAIISAILKAIVSHIYLAWIHPFGDGNGRTARLIEFQILISSGVPAPAAHLLSNHYNHTRAEYYRLLDASSRSGGDLMPFLVYAIRGFVDGLRSQLQVIRDQQWGVAWENYVHEQFKGEHTVCAERRKHLVLDLSRKAGLVPISELSQLSPRVAAAYAKKTKRTLARDVNALVKMRLVFSTPKGVSARKHKILAFLPIQALEH